MNLPFEKERHKVHLCKLNTVKKPDSRNIPVTPLRSLWNHLRDKLLHLLASEKAKKEKINTKSNPLKQVSFIEKSPYDSGEWSPLDRDHYSDIENKEINQFDLSEARQLIKLIQEEQ